MASLIPGLSPHVNHPTEMLTAPGSHAGRDNNIALIVTIDCGFQLNRNVLN